MMRRFPILRRRLLILEQELYTVAKVIDNTDWAQQPAQELQALTMRGKAAEDEIEEISKLLDTHARFLLFPWVTVTVIGGSVLIWWVIQAR